nr:serine/arginine repetitive matrix protein 1-like [Marmota flaviventris]
MANLQQFGRNQSRTTGQRSNENPRKFPRGSAGGLSSRCISRRAGGRRAGPAGSEGRHASPGRRVRLLHCSARHGGSGDGKGEGSGVGFLDLVQEAATAAEVSAAAGGRRRGSRHIGRGEQTAPWLSAPRLQPAVPWSDDSSAKHDRRRPQRSPSGRGRGERSHRQAPPPPSAHGKAPLQAPPPRLAALTPTPRAALARQGPGCYGRNGSRGLYGASGPAGDDDRYPNGQSHCHPRDSPAAVVASARTHAQSTLSPLPPPFPFPSLPFSPASPLRTPSTPARATGSRRMRNPPADSPPFALTRAL